jgi:hypothetical protein
MHPGCAVSARLGHLMLQVVGCSGVGVWAGLACWRDERAILLSVLFRHTRDSSMLLPLRVEAAMVCAAASGESGQGVGPVLQPCPPLIAAPRACAEKGKGISTTC